MQGAEEAISLNGAEGQKVAEDNYSVMGRRGKAINIGEKLQQERENSSSFCYVPSEVL